MPNHPQYSAPVPIAKQRLLNPITPLHLIVQFPDNPNVRFLFPKHSILEFDYQESVVSVNFVVVKKGSEAADPTGLNPDAEYWTPVSLYVTADSHTLDLFGRYVAPADEARAHMENIFDRCKAAEETHLAFRLPREGVEA